MAARVELIRLPIEQMADQLSIDRNTLSKRLKQAEIEAVDGTYTIKQAMDSINGSKQAESLKLTKAKREQAEFDLAVARKDYMSTEDTIRFILDTFGPLREFIISQPGRLAALVNPADPQHARAHLDRDRDEFLKLKPKLPECNTQPTTSSE